MNTSATRCTVLMPVYNSEPYLVEAIQSILTQTFQDFHLLIIDDGSTDGSLEIARSFTDERITVLSNETNQGLVATLNQGLASIQTEYIARMDADDIAVPDRLERQITMMDAHPEIGLCGGYFEKFFPDSIPIKRQVVRPALTRDGIRFQLLLSNAFGHFTVMIRRAVLLQHRLIYSAAYPYAEDYELWTRFGQCTGIANIPHILAYYRVHGTASSVRFQEQQEHSAQRVRIQQAMHLGLEIRTEDRAIYDQLLALSFTGGVSELHVASRLLDELYRFGVEQLHQPRLLVLQWLNRYWYSACSRSAHHGLTIFWIYCSQPYGLKVRTRRTVKLLYYCLKRSNNTS